MDGWIVALSLALPAVCAAGYLVLRHIRKRLEATNWLLGLNRRTGLDATWDDNAAVLADQVDGSHDRYAQMTDELRQVAIDYCESMWAASERSRA